MYRYDEFDHAFVHERVSQFREQVLGVLEIRGIEALGEPPVDWGEQIVGLGAPTLIAPQPGKAGRGAQLQRLRILALGGVDRPLEP